MDLCLIIQFDFSSVGDKLGQNGLSTKHLPMWI